MELNDIFRETQRVASLPQGIEAVFDNSPELGDQAYVKIPEFDGGVNRLPAYGWERSEDLLPVEGDPCLVQLSSGARFWVIAWTSSANG